MKDQFTTFLPLSLSRTCEVNYIRSEDGIHTKPALTSDIPKEHSEYEQDLERVNYTIQDYYQTGIRKFVLENWVKRLKHEAEEEREINKEYGSDQDKIRSIDETKAGELFKDYFPNHSLSTPLEVQIDSLVKALNEDMTCLRRYLSRELAKIDSSNARITCDAHNLVSMAKSTSGASATLSGIHGLHQKILGITPDKRKASIMHAREKGTVGEMTLRVIDKSAKAPSFLRYDPACPEDLLNDVFKVDPNFQSIVDGAAAFHGLKKEKFVKQLLNKQKNIKGIVHFGEDGKKKVMTSEGVRVLLQSELKPTELGMWLSEKGSRGADVRLGPQNRALITANPRQRLPEVLQTAGRLRIRSQQLRYVAPKGSSISTPQDLLKVSLENEALIEADNLFRAKKHELRDIVRNAVMEKLIKLATEGKETELLDSYDALAEKRRNIFITRNEADYEVEGTYFQQHHPIEKKVEPTILLNSYRDQLCAVTQKLGLDQAQRDLNAIQYDKELASLLPSQVKTGRQTDSEVEVETETQTELELETELEAEEELKMNWYLPWINPIDQKHYAVHNLNKDVSDIFDLALYITENFLPLRRKEWAEKPWHRTPHDSKQNPALHLVIPITDITSKYDKPKKKKMLFGRLPKEMKEAPIKTWLEKGKPVLVDLCEVEGKTLGLENHFVYDLRLKRGISEKQVPNPNLLAWYVAQARFYDGQFQLAQYTKAEYQALLHWILEKKDPKKLEDYFVKRVLRHRPDDYEKYGYSQLRRFFILMRQLLKQPRQYLKGSPELTELKKFSEKFSLHPDVLERGLNFAPGFKGTAVEQFIKEAQV